jgi:hypothetical protein
MESQPTHCPKVEVPPGVAVKVTVDPLAKLAVQFPAQLRPVGELVTVPEPVPTKATLRVDVPEPEPDPVPVKQTTLAVMYPVTIDPLDLIPPALLLVFTVAETKVPPQTLPVAVIMPVEPTVTICGVFEAHVTRLVMSLVTGGWM